jgi:hypothetical protein
LGHAVLTARRTAAYAAVGLLTVVIVVSLAGPLLVCFFGPGSSGYGTVHTVSQALPGSVAALFLLPAIPWLVGNLAGWQAALCDRVIHESDAVGHRAAAALTRLRATHLRATRLRSAR